MEREKLIAAAKLIQANCENPKNLSCGNQIVDCPFQRETILVNNYMCSLSFDVPDWKLPEVQDDDKK